jgi:hypothetical protein
LAKCYLVLKKAARLYGHDLLQGLLMVSIPQDSP